MVSSISCDSSSVSADSSSIDTCSEEEDVTGLKGRVKRASEKTPRRIREFLTRVMKPNNVSTDSDREVTEKALRTRKYERLSETKKKEVDDAMRDKVYQGYNYLEVDTHRKVSKKKRKEWARRVIEEKEKRPIIFADHVEKGGPFNPEVQH